MSLVKMTVKNVGGFFVGLFALLTVWVVLRWMILGGVPPWGDLAWLAGKMAFALVFIVVAAWIGSHFTVLD